MGSPADGWSVQWGRMALVEPRERLFDLRRDKSSGREKPYKPALLLALFDLIERGDFPRIASR